jgi:hypothetical protein
MEPAQEHLGWSESQANRDFAIAQMIEVGTLGYVRLRLSPRCNVLSVIPWIRQNSLRARPLVPNSLTSRWTSCRVRSARFSFFRFCHPPTSTKFAAKW